MRLAVQVQDALARLGCRPAGLLVSAALPWSQTRLPQDCCR